MDLRSIQPVQCRVMIFAPLSPSWTLYRLCQRCLLVFYLENSLQSQLIITQPPALQQCRRSFRVVVLVVVGLAVFQIFCFRHLASLLSFLRCLKNSRNKSADASAYSGIWATRGFHRCLSVSNIRAFAVIPPPLSSVAAK